MHGISSYNQMKNFFSIYNQIKKMQLVTSPIWLTVF